MKRAGRAAEILAWSLFFVAAAFALAVRFWLLPGIERYRGEIVVAVSRAVGQPVSIGAIEARWKGWSPHVRLRDVRVYDHAGREVLALPSVENRVSWRSVVLGEVRVLGLAIEGLRVQVRRDAEGALHVAGMKLGAGETRFSRWALAQDEIVLRNAEIEWHDELRGAPPLVLSSLNLRLRNAGDQHALGFTARPPAALGSTLEVRAVLEGNRLAEPASWTGRIYAELGNTDLAGWRAWIDYPWRVERGHGALRAWLTLAQGELREATADLALSDVSTQLAADLAPLHLASLRGRLQGARQDGRYRLRADDLSVGVGGGALLQPADFELRWSAGDGAQGSFEAAALELEPLTALAAGLPLPEKVRSLVAEMRPRGALAEARAEWRGPGNFAARAKFIGLAAAPSGALPGFAGLTGSFDADANGARIVFATRKGELFLPRVLPDPRVPLDVLNGLVEVERRAGDRFALRLSSLAFANAQLSGSASGNYESAPGSRGRIDLSADVARADAAQLDRYLPHARLMGGEAGRAWLVRAVQAGHASNVRVRIRGDLRDFPFSDPKLGQFSVTSRIERASVQFAEGWPRIDNVHGELAFEREGMRLRARSATTLGVALSDVEVSIPQLVRAPREVHVAGRAEGATAEFLRYVHASPLRRRTGGLIEGVSATGAGTLRLKLEIPLGDPAATRVAGDYQFRDNQLTVHSQLPPIEAARGKLVFTDSAFNVESVEGQLFGGPMAMRGESLAEGGMHLVAKGEATVAGTRSLFEHPWQRYLSGQAAYVATVSSGKGRPAVVVRSSLQGMTSSLPAPLAKRAGESLPLQLEFGPEQPTRLRLGRIVAAEFLRDRAAVVLSPGAGVVLRLPPQPGTALSGTLPALDLDKWLPLFSGAGGAAPQATAFDVRIGALDLYGKRVNDAALRGTLEAAGWSTVIASQELAGDLSYRVGDGGKLVARLTRFRTPEAPPGAAPRDSIEPKGLPAMDLVAERFVLRGKDLGRVEIQGSRAGEDWRIERLAMTNAEAQLSASGVWRSGTPTLSDLRFELQASDAGLFLGRVGYPGLVKGGVAHLKGALAWQGEPSLIDYASLAGSIDLQAKSGQFLEIEPGFGKLVSLMSLQSLPRRITLDFRDVFSKGFGFDEIRSSGEVSAGVMKVKEFRMQGSSAQVEMNGEVDLAHETQNVRVRVVPSLGDSASTVIALVNPLLAIPAAIAQKILKDPLGHIFAFDYAVTGGWNDPKVAKVGVEAREANPSAANP